MWQAPNQRTRSSIQKRSHRRRIHIQRTTAEVRFQAAPDAPPVTSQVRVLLNDLSPKGMGMFSVSELAAGQEISIVLTDPIPITLKARVVWSQKHAVDSHIMSSQAYSYRLGVEFTFASPEEEQSAQKLYDDIAKGLYHR